MPVSFLVVDMQRLMDDSKVGQEAAKAVAARFDAAQGEYKKLLEKAAKAPAGKDKTAAEAKVREFDQQSIKAIKTAQDALRLALLKRAQPFVDDAMKATGAEAVLDRAAVLMCDPVVDITNQLIAKVDALGPLTP
jgi:Skp family chaperone for outer membrane proteins